MSFVHNVVLADIEYTLNIHFIRHMLCILYVYIYIAYSIYVCEKGICNQIAIVEETNTTIILLSKYDMHCCTARYITIVL